LDGTCTLTLPVLTECNAIPDSREEIPTPNVARALPHLLPIANKIPELCQEAEILLLLGRDAPLLHKIHESRNGPENAPWAQRLDLGWVVIGNSCLDGAHKPNKLSAYRTQILHNGRPSFLLPCTNWLCLKHGSSTDSTAYLVTDRKKGTIVKGKFEDGLGDNVFLRSVDDNKSGMSMEDRKFIDIVNHSLTRIKSGHWEAPLPLREETRVLPDNQKDTLRCLKSTIWTLDKKPSMRKHYFDFMQKLLENDHAEPVPDEEMPRTNH